MKAAYYERQGPPSAVLRIADFPDPEPGPEEVRIRVAASGVNPGDVKKRDDAFGVGMPYPQVIPHSDGAGWVDRIGPSVPGIRPGQRVWWFGAQSYRAFGTAAEYVVVPAEQVVPLPDEVSFEQGACLGIPGITAHRAVHVAGPVAGRTVLVQGGAGAVGQCAVALARHAGARVVATVRSDGDRSVPARAGADQVVVTAGASIDDVAQEILAEAPQGVDHIVEVAFHANIELDEHLLRQGGSIATYATGASTPTIPFWPLVFKNVSLFFIGSDDFQSVEKRVAAAALHACLTDGWPGFEIGMRLPLGSIAQAHEVIEQGAVKGRVVLALAEE